MHKYLKYNNTYYALKKYRDCTSTKVIKLYTIAGMALYSYNITHIDTQEIIKNIITTLLDNSNIGYFRILKDMSTVISDYSNPQNLGLYNVINNYINNNDTTELELYIILDETYSISYLLYLARYRINELMKDTQKLQFLFDKINQTDVNNNMEVLESVNNIIKCYIDPNNTEYDDIIATLYNQYKLKYYLPNLIQSKN